MVEYLARYGVQAQEYSFGGWRPYETKGEYQFTAVSELEARDEANNHRFTIAKNLFGAVVRLESLLEVKELKLESAKKN